MFGWIALTGVYILFMIALLSYSKTCKKNDAYEPCSDRDEVAFKLAREMVLALNSKDPDIRKKHQRTINAQKEMENFIFAEMKKADARIRAGKTEGNVTYLEGGLAEQPIERKARV